MAHEFVHRGFAETSDIRLPQNGVSSCQTTLSNSESQYPQNHTCVQVSSGVKRQQMNTITVLIGALAIIIVIFLLWRRRAIGRPIPPLLQPGRKLPDFSAIDEDGNARRSSELVGRPTVMLFVRGNWCPFCTSQVKDLSSHYKEIVDLGARLILVTPKPLQTTRRVAEMFAVEFDFWLDADLLVAKQLALVMESEVPKKHREQFGSDTLWPTSLIIDGNGVIRYTELSKFILDRPDPKKLLGELRAIV